MNKPLLSILTPAIWERSDQAKRLALRIQELAPEGLVEHLAVYDNRSRSIGLKRQACLDLARGEYVAFIDDDDEFNIEYFNMIIPALRNGPDVVTFRQKVIIDNKRGEAVFGLQNPDEPFAEGEFKRNIWHVCPIRAEIAKQGIFPDKSYGEDIEWLLQVRPFLRSSIHIHAELHTYVYNSKTSAAPVPV